MTLNSIFAASLIAFGFGASSEQELQTVYGDGAMSPMDLEQMLMDDYPFVYNGSTPTKQDCEALRNEFAQMEGRSAMITEQANTLCSIYGIGFSEIELEQASTQAAIGEVQPMLPEGFQHEFHTVLELYREFAGNRAEMLNLSSKTPEEGSYSGRAVSPSSMNSFGLPIGIGDGYSIGGTAEPRTGIPLRPTEPAR